MNIALSADSTLDLSPEFCRQYNVSLVPAYVVMDGQSYLDGKTCFAADVFAYVERTGSLPRTSAPPPGDYAALFEELLKENDAVIHIAVSSTFTSCCRNALLAAEDFPGKVFVVDSFSVSNGGALLVPEAAAAIARGEDPETITAALEARREKLNLSFLLSTLDHLHKSGRCSALAALGGNLLNLRPCIECRDGKLVVGKKYRGSLKKALAAYIAEHVEGRGDIDRSRIFLAHSGIEEELLAALIAQLEAAGFQEVICSPAGCAIATHVGPGCAGIMFQTV